jgi:ABC-type Fe3+/spermidine/putrescine transport system ATPase subunit
MMDKFLRTAHLTKHFGPRRVVEDVSVEIAAAETVVIVGPSGCGKTTFLRLLAGLERPEGGEIWIGGRLVARSRETLVPPHHRAIGFVFQDLALWPHFTVQQQLDFALQSARLSKSERRARARELLDLVRIGPLAARYPHQISGGEQQRVALARALAGKPQLLLLDEPFSSLDPELRATLRQEVVRLQRAMRIAAIYVSHDREDAATLADRVFEMRDGRIVSTGQGVRKEASS